MAILGFKGEHRFLSNFWPAKVSFEGLTYQTVEHAYQAAKTTNVLQRAHITVCSTPGQAKRMGKTLDLRPDWDKVKFAIMHGLVTSKFFDNPELRQKLLNTGDKNIVEINKWGDVYWGVCDGVGTNCMGIILMDVRRDLTND